MKHRKPLVPKPKMCSAELFGNDFGARLTADRANAAEWIEWTLLWPFRAARALWKGRNKRPVGIKHVEIEPTDEQILSSIGAWMLCCAVGAYNKTLSTSGRLDFDTWIMCCRTTWIPRIAKELHISEQRIEKVAREYAQRNAHRSYLEVAESEKLLHPDKGAA